ncbi:putative Glutamate dehydrogenase leucine dehydrogenase [Mesorhizobium sp. ORS 3324]|nr:putative Glutamate dehydrogenase leucine dehydrogenase [Mesorhizobium sp. ORS 3324]
MPHFFFDISDTGDVYHDARGALLPGTETAKERALEMVRKLVTGPSPTRYRDLVCTVRDIDGSQIMQIRIEFGTPVVISEISN